MRRTSIVFLAASLLAPALLFSVGCSSSKVATDGGGELPDGAVDDAPFVDRDLGPPRDGGGTDGAFDPDLGAIDLGWVDVDLGPATLCGDGVLTAPEQCDDGNTTAGDGCDATCNVEASVCPGGAAPRTLTPGTNLHGDTTGVASAASGSCGGGTSGENTFVFTVYEESDVALTTDFPATAFNAAVYVRSACADRTTELGCAAAAPAGDTLTLSALPAGTYFAFVDGAGGESGAYEVGITVTRRIPVGGTCDPMGATGACVDGSTCTADATGAYACRSPSSICGDAARALTLGAAATGGTTVGAEDLYAPSCSSDGAAPDRVFSVAVPAGAYDLVVTSTPTNFAADSFDVVLTVETACGDAGSAVGCSDARAADATEEVVVQNATGTYFIVVDGYGTAMSFTTGEFEVAARLRDIVALDGACDPTGFASRCDTGLSCAGTAGAETCIDPAAAVCATATAITPGTPVNATLGTMGVTSDLAPSCARDGGTDERLYYVDLAAPGFLSARATGAGIGFQTTVYIRGAGSCGATADLVCDTFADRRLETTTGALAAGRYYVIVDGTGTYDLTVTLGTFIAAGGMCDAASTTARCATGTACLGGVCSAVTTIADTSPNGLFCDAQGPASGDTLFTGDLTVGGATDYDTVQINLAAPARLAITTSDGAGGCIADTLVEVFDGAMSCTALDAAMPPPMPLASDDNSGIAMLCSSLTTAVLPAGTYYVRVRHPFARTPGGAYQLLIDVI